MEGINRQYDPESLLTAGEAAEQGFSYNNSHRDWPNEKLKARAESGMMLLDAIPSIAPRVFNSFNDFVQDANA